MSHFSLRFLAAMLGVIGLVSYAGSRLAAQQSTTGGRFSIVGAFDSTLDGGEPATVSAQFTTATAEQPALVMITVRLQPGWHAYAITQPRSASGGPQPTKIKLTPSPKYRLLAPFHGHPEPKKRIDDAAWIGLELQEHEGEVVWYAPVELAAGVDPASLEIRGLVDMQVCKEQCVPVKSPFAARQGGQESRVKSRELMAVDPGLKAATALPALDPRLSTVGSFQANESAVKFTGRIEPARVRPGQTAKLSLAATATGGWHLYAYAARDDQPGSKPTLIAFESTWGLPAGRPATDAPITIDNSVKDFPPMHYHEGPVTWTIDIHVPADAEPGAYPLAGIVGYQACEFRPGGMGSCEIPKAARFRTTLNVGDVAAAAGSSQVTFASASYSEAVKISATWADVLDGQPPKPERSAAASQNDDRAAVVGSPGDPEGPAISATNPYDLSLVRVQEQTGSLWGFIGMAFVGGLILNLMPCVLPVIGLKVMSFVEQAGKSRSHALVLNGWYALGIVAVFLLLGVLAVSLGLSWGGQFGNTGFNVAIAAVVFAMALSLLGVWEIPIPGFFGSGAVQDAAAQEGPLGAFLKGVVTTVLATPCTAPFMASAIAWAVTQSVPKTLAVFGSLGLGMASPYLLVGVFPELLRFLPKPGRWMETFKQLTGFILLGTVVFILSFIEPAAVVPTLLLLVGIGMACWIFARTPLSAEFRDRAQSWAMAGAVLLLFGVASFGWLYPDVMWPRYGGMRSALKEGWDPFTLTKLQKVAVEGRRTAIVDFSANWCFNCKVLENAVLHTQDVEQAIAGANAVKLYADYSDYPQEITTTIKALKSSGVPVIAIFPGDRPYEPIVFRGGYTKAGLIEALKDATVKPVTAGGRTSPEVAAAMQ